MTGAGNDFILFDGIKNNTPDLTPAMIQSICRRGLGIGADGVLVVLPSKNFDYKLKYFNSDGTSGMLCANGARASIIYAHAKLFPDKLRVAFECCKNKFTGKVKGENEAVFNLPDIDKGAYETVAIRENELKVYLADTGAPQAVIDFLDLNFTGKSFDDFDFVPFAKKIRYHKKFLPAGINVNVLLNEDGRFKIRSFERGVEDETLACGTGIIAAAMFLSDIKGEKTPIEIFSRSKKKFIINFRKKMTNFESVSLRGHAAIVFNGTIEI